MVGSNPRGLPESRSGSTNTGEPTSEYRAGGGPLVQQRTLCDDDGHELNIKVSHGSNVYDVCAPSNSTFGDMKRLIGQKTGLEPQVQKLLFRGKEKDDCDPLQMAGVKDNSKILLMESTREKDMNSEEMENPNQISVGGEAVAEVRAEVDNLSKQVSALQAVVNGGTKVEDKQIVYLTEMLMRQLLKLDSIEAEGEGKMQRKQEVHRIQARNSNPFIDSDNTVSVTTQWETFDSGAANVSAPTSVHLSTEVTQEWERFD